MAGRRRCTVIRRDQERRPRSRSRGVLQSATSCAISSSAASGPVILLSKSRFVSAQLLAYVETGLWQRNATRANDLARQIGRAAGAALLHPVEANEVFLHLGDERKARLRKAGFEFYDWGPETSGEARFVASWDQPEEDVAAL